LCVIIDTCVAGHVFSVPREADYVPLWHWLEKKDGKLVYGGHLARELGRSGKTVRLLAELKRSGRALECCRQDVDKHERAVRKLGLCRSNDPHVIALARVSGARILCTNDADLQTDFKDQRLLSSPRGQIYKKASHKAILKHNGICIGGPKK
jgi:hypothetical protein